ncbi:hypothetical protein VPH35_034689 [Triticum aestivum]
MTFRMIGRALGDGYVHSKPNLSTMVTSSVLNSPPSRGSTVSSIEPSWWCSRTHSTNNTRLFCSSMKIGLRPHVTSRRNTPNAYTSEKGVGLPARKSSGARYPMVPATWVVSAAVSCSYFLGRPKSPNCPFILLSKSTLLAFTSRWMMTCSHSSCSTISLRPHL